MKEGITSNIYEDDVKLLNKALETGSLPKSALVLDGKSIGFIDQEIVGASFKMADDRSLLIVEGKCFRPATYRSRGFNKNSKVMFLED